jgi:cellulose synthase/poly-beta-1,6-N-acetylglucosamine synthase-like glycosyltransferase
LEVALALTDEMIYWIWQLCFGASALGCVYLLTASILVFLWRRRGRKSHARLIRQTSRSVTVLLPLHGNEPKLFDRLLRFCSQDYAGNIQLVLGAVARSDPAIDVVEQFRRAFPNKAAVLNVDSQEHGANRKISNLANMTFAAQHDILIAADSDIQVGQHYVADIVEQLEKPGVRAVICLYHGIPGAGLWSSLSALAINGHFLPEVVMALSLGLATPCFGATLALRRSLLKSIGGFSAFADFLAEDYGIGQAVRISGHDRHALRFRRSRMFRTRFQVPVSASGQMRPHNQKHRPGGTCRINYYASVSIGFARRALRTCGLPCSGDRGARRPANDLYRDSENLFHSASAILDDSDAGHDRILRLFRQFL